MLSAVARYKQLLSSALARYFPHTTAYLRAEREAAQPRKPARKQSKKKSTGNKKASGRKTDSGKPGPAGIYPGTRLKVEDAQVQAMRERVAQAVNARLIGAPSAEQWAMILCRAPLARIFAGAGSGKSSTLVLRVVFLLCHLEVDPKRLTVISFTNASCSELRERLQRLLDFWHYPHDARQCVRTFHAAMATLAKEHLGNPRWFEQLDEPGDEPDNPLTGGRLRPAQQRLLKQAYQNAYAEDARFRVLTHRLLKLPAPEEPPQGKAKAPLDACKLPGEFTALPLFELLHGQIDFAESLGIRLDRLEVKTLGCAARERDFIEAMQRFHQHFNNLLKHQGLISFNGAFAQLSERLSSDDGKPGPALLALSHLLIDEFQDISPQIVLWLQAVHRRLHAAGERISLMAIGDDWQSIYGWRGSSPELFIDFDRHFPSRGRSKSTTLLLGTNYRSIEPVIRDGEKVLAEVQNKQAKTCVAAKAMQPGDHGVRLIQRFDLASGLPALLQEITAQCQHVSQRANADRTAVLLLSRRNEPLQQVRAQLDKALPVRAMTIHRAKGLQAEVAIILDDCLPVEKHPLRNALYAHCGFFAGSYDQAMQDEARRLAYVAITRGVSRVLWYTRKAQGATQCLAASRPIAQASG
ncbi:UvrD/REP helicase N-terminal domain-containing protein [Ectopseudomonas chengduensis]|uniref:UvrD/REP helicase N-terminal domain-containing protein n=1 Tax=Ectopseudomonas chengduensis TaxID=489632 RepID=A0A1G6KY74_9GAMM|nr:DEAD/DEAH box helicase [Pseudomonas chengduensis]MBP3061172.1 UvrD-helicase domain-containing protein [Pseudomonas chengduensis]NNB74078.1 UvrD-helicase domain-containing protein [Pseudomonas chengduensis]SDC35887.1 UvrD/REP helicase N-terminal domain-containing protein [Pseudomonas chengduensis]